MTPLDDLGLFIGKFLAVLGMLHYYSNPLPGVAFSFHQIFSETARHMAALIDLSILEQLVQRIQAITSGLEKPGFTDIIGIWNDARYLQARRSGNEDSLHDREIAARTIARCRDGSRD